MKVARVEVAALCLMASFLSFGKTARAYTVGSAFTEPCHERITVRTLDLFYHSVDWGEVPTPTDDVSREIRSAFSTAYSERFLATDAAQQTILYSMLIGVRAPDTEGHSSSDLGTLRAQHLSPDGQYSHALRGPSDDGSLGDELAVSALQEVVRELVGRARERYFSSDPMIRVPVYVDPYGTLDVQVWGPAYYLGRALHAIQDSFSHTLRTPDLRRIVHVFNFLEAASGSWRSARYEVRRDGLRHSNAMDSCSPDGATAPLYNAAEQASRDFLIIVLFGEASRTLGDVEPFLSRWLTYEAGCDPDGACQSDFVSVARQRPTTPIGCAVESLGSGSQPAAWWCLIAVVISFRRRAVTLGAVAFALVSCGDANFEVHSELSPLAPCGGDLRGRWYAVSSNTVYTSAEDISAEGCGAYVEVRPTFYGSIRFDDGLVDSNLRGTTVSEATRALECVEGECETSGDDFGCAEDAGGCVCLDYDDFGLSHFTSYSTVGSQLRLDDPVGGESLDVGYCVDGDVLWWTVDLDGDQNNVQRFLFRRPAE